MNAVELLHSTKTRLEVAHKRYAEARKAHQEELLRCLPPGQDLGWQHGNKNPIVCVGKVAHFVDGRGVCHVSERSFFYEENDVEYEVYVHNPKTDNTYWIQLAKILWVGTESQAGPKTRASAV